MKKRLISMLLTVLMVASLFSGMPLSAYAVDANDVFEYTMTDGDTVLAVCNAYGLNYYTCKAAIMQLNGFTSDQNFRYIPIGKVIKLPVSNAVAVSISANGVTTTTTSQTGSTTTTTTTTANANGETIAYWLIPYTLQRGETVYSVCNALGIPYGTYASQIQKINNIKSLSWVKAGQTILFPSVKTPAVGVSCYEVRAHKVTAGETAYSICNADGVSYNGNLQLLKGLNDKDNLNYIASGSVFYVPVSTVITASTGTSGSPAGSTTTATPAATATAAPVTKVLYALKSNSSTGGIVGFYVDGKTVTEAAAGDVVTVVPVADSGKALKSLSVVFSDGSAVPVLSGGNTFVMPTCAVTANAEFKGGYLITLDSNYTTHVKLMIDGVAGNSASTGSLVQVVSGDPGLSVDGKVIVTKSTGGDVKVSSDNSFKMPGCDVTVKVNLKSVTTYDFYKTIGKYTASNAGALVADANIDKTKNGSFVLQSNGVTISKAAKGTEVTVLASPSVGYSVDDIDVYQRAENGTLGTAVTVRNGVFTMPAQDVCVVVSFAADSSDINIAGTVNGTVLVSSGAGTTGDPYKPTTIGLTGTTYYVFVKGDTGYTPNQPTVKSIYDQTMVSVTPGADSTLNALQAGKNAGTYKVYSFVMPGKGALVSASFKGAEKTVTTEVKELSGIDVSGACTVRINNDVAPVTVPADELVNLSVSLPDGIVLSRYEVDVPDKPALNQELSGSAGNNSFLMPAYNVKVTAYVEAQSVAVSNLENVNGYSVRFVKYDSSTGSWNLAETMKAYKVGEKVGFVVTPKTGSETVNPSQILVTGANSLTPISVTQDGDVFTFTMPAEGVNVNVTAAKKSFSISLKSTLGRKDGDLVAIVNNVSMPLTSDTTKIKASQGDAIYIDVNETLKAQGYTISKIVTNTVSGTPITSRIDYSWFNTWSFPMPADDVTVDADISIPSAGIAWDIASIQYCEVTLASDTTKPVSTVKVGDDVHVKLTAVSGYKLADSLGNKFVTLSGVTGTVNIDSTRTVATIDFKMPVGTVLITAKAKTETVAPVALMAAEDSRVEVTVGSTMEALSTTRDVYPGQTVQVQLTAAAAATQYIESVTVDGNAASKSGDVWSFVMPSAAATLAVTVKDLPKLSSSDANKDKVDVTVNGTKYDLTGDVIVPKDYTVKIELKETQKATMKLTGVTYGASATAAAETSAGSGVFTFKMPNENTTVALTVVTLKDLTVANATTNGAKLIVTVNGTSSDLSAARAVFPGDTVKVELTEAAKATQTLTDVTGTGVTAAQTSVGSGVFTFKMPADATEIALTFAP